MPALGQVITLDTSPARDVTAVFRLEGEFDVSNAATFELALAQAFESGHRNIVLDLSTVSFLDRTVLNVMVLGLKRSMRRRGRFALVRPPQPVWRIFSLTGLDTTIPAFEDVAQAMTHCESRGKEVTSMAPVRPKGILGRIPHRRP